MKTFTTEEAQSISDQMNMDGQVDIEQFRMGLETESEHGSRNPLTNVTNDDSIVTGKIALAHLQEIPDYYSRLQKMERKADKDWKCNREKVEAKEALLNSMVSFQQQVDAWKLQLNSFTEKTSLLQEQPTDVQIAEKKKRFLKKEKKFKKRCERELEEINILNESVISFKEKLAEEVERGRKKLKKGTAKEDEKISKRMEAYTDNFEDVEKEFQKLMASVEYVSEEIIQTNNS